MNLTSGDVLFVGRQTGAVSWYRTGQPAFHLGCDWVAFDHQQISEEPLQLDPVVALARAGMERPDFFAYKIVVLQQPMGTRWLSLIRKLRERGIIVLYEIDDYIHVVRKIKGHESRAAYSKKNLYAFEMCMRACDGLIVSTKFLAQRYRHLNRHIWVCRNSIEATRYSQYELPERKTLNVGWEGGVGHMEAVRTWLPAIESLLDQREDVCFYSIGMPMADWLPERLQDRALALPYVSLEIFPAVMTNLDIAIGPARANDFYRAKSDLRYLEAGALGIPLVGHPIVYGEAIEHNVNGMLAKNANEALLALVSLVDDPDKRHRIGTAARTQVLGERDIGICVDQWEAAFVEAATLVAA